MRRRFRPALVPSLAFVLLLPLLLWLGWWQVDRAREKEALQADYDQRADQTVRIAPHVQPVGDLQFYHVAVRGYYEPAYQVLIDNRVHLGQAGYYVVTPLRIEHSDTRVLVNRGWIPLGESRQHPPAIETPAGLQEVSGVATVPAEKVFTLGPVVSAGGGWQAVWEFLDMKRYARSVPFPMQPVVVLLDPASRAGGFVREWERLDAGIAVHEAYAFQWFTLAITLIVIYVALNVRQYKKDSQT